MIGHLLCSGLMHRKHASGKKAALVSAERSNDPLLLSDPVEETLVSLVDPQ